MADLTTTLNAAIASAISGKTPGSATQAMYSAGVRNAGLFVGGSLDISCISQTSGTAPGATAIDPSFVLMANHYGWDNPAFNFVLTFIGADGSSNVRTFTAGGATSQQIAGTDIRLVKLPTPLPASVTPAKLPPADWRSYAPSLNLPVVYTNQSKTLSVGILNPAPQGQELVVGQKTGDTAPWYTPIITGDSGNPIALIVNGALNVVAHWHTTIAGPDYADNAAAIQTAMTSMGGGSVGIADWSDTFHPGRTRQ